MPIVGRSSARLCGIVAVAQIATAATPVRRLRIMMFCFLPCLACLAPATAARNGVGAAASFRRMKFMPLVVHRREGLEFIVVKHAVLILHDLADIDVLH